MDDDANVDSLREQFQHLQEQHQNKLLLRKQRLMSTSLVGTRPTPSAQNIESNENRNDSNIPNNSSGLLGCEVEDNLELRLEKEFGENLPRKKNTDNVTRELKDENGRLRKLLAERDEEMRILRKQMNQERQNIIGSGLASDTAANRIMELSKKNREFASDIEREKRKVKQVTKKLSELQNQNCSGPPDTSAVGSKNQKIAEKSAPDEEQANSQHLQEKLKQALAKVAEYRNQCEILKKEARLTQKVIAKECGDGVNINAILNEPSGWRGRQQQITSLQNKVNELRQQLNEAAKLAQSSSHFPSTTLNFQRVTTPSFHDEKHKHMLRKMEKNKKETYEKVSSDLEALSDAHSKLQTKFDAAKTRNIILTNDLKGLKTQAKMLVDKGAHDDELISALMREQERLQKTLEKKTSQMASDRSYSRQEKVQQDKELVLTLTRLCKEREEKVTKLEEELKTMVVNDSYGTAELVDKATITDDCTTSNILSSPVVDYQPNRQGSTMSNVSTDSSPRRRRIVSRSTGASSLPPTPPRSGHSALSSEGRSQKLEEFQPLYEAIKVERDRLVELVSVLQEREKDARESVFNISNDVKNLQRQNVEMEKKLARISTGQNSRQEKMRKPQHTRRQKGVEEPTNDVHHVEELQTKLAIQEDENDALKEALDATLHGKKEDFLFYQDIVEQTKQVFLQGLHQYRKTSAPT